MVCVRLFCLYMDGSPMSLADGYNTCYSRVFRRCVIVSYVYTSLLFYFIYRHAIAKDVSYIHCYHHHSTTSISVLDSNRIIQFCFDAHVYSFIHNIWTINFREINFIQPNGIVFILCQSENPLGFGFRRRTPRACIITMATYIIV